MYVGDAMLSVLDAMTMLSARTSVRVPPTTREALHHSPIVASVPCSDVVGN